MPPIPPPVRCSPEPGVADLTDLAAASGRWGCRLRQVSAKWRHLVVAGSRLSIPGSPLAPGQMKSTR